MLESSLLGADPTGLLRLLSDPKSGDQPIEPLHAFWQALVPEEIQQALREQKYKRMIVVPDGLLALLPFEALVVESSSQPKFLVDLDVTISYAPSATFLYRLAERKAAGAPADIAPVLALGDPAYGSDSSDRLASRTDGADYWRSRYGRLGGQLNRLPYSGREAGWVAEVFAKNGVQAEMLRQAAATEAAVRVHAPHRRILHLACHGLTDQSHHNFFGALALTPGRGRANPADDGFLTLHEIYEFDLRSCELAILSACQTNYGPQQAGEGVWALTRGFLVAGARRVIASNWLVDDEAAASQISYYCGILAKNEKEGRPPEYARGLIEAKRWVRNQQRWHHPYYWATFVLVGPN